jgi:hypothetical protein
VSAGVYDRVVPQIASTLGFAVSPRAVQRTPSRRGEVLTAISEGMVGLLKEFYGRGPTRTKSYYEGDVVTCLLRGGSRAASRRCGRAAAVRL